jgi:DNA invertase Pin-like site-specific DNA recombinase
MEENSEQKPIAYSYVRFSTPEQMKGDSVRRQTELAEKYARENGLTLDKSLTFSDLGLSAFDGRNARVGALRAFLNLVESEQIRPGSYLLVESLDRISREAILRAQGLFLEIIGAGIILVTLGDSRIYSKSSINANPSDLIISIVSMMRAHEESATKSRRLVAVYEHKREALRQGAQLRKPFTRRLPAWLEWREGEGYALNEARAKVVAEIFQKADDGWGQHQIAHWLNQSGCTPFGRAKFWHRSYVRKLLTSPAVVGTFVPHRIERTLTGERRRQPLEPVRDLWPRVVSQEVFDRVSRRVGAVQPRGRNAAKAIASIVAGLAKCAHCGGSVVRVSKGDYVYLVCSRAHAHAGCKYQAVGYGEVEAALVKSTTVLAEEVPLGIETAELEQEIAALDVVCSEYADEARFLADELVLAKSDAIRHRLEATEEKLKAARSELTELRARRLEVGSPYVLRRIQHLFNLLNERPLNIGLTNLALKDTVKQVIINPEAGELNIHWHHAPNAPTSLMFYSRHITLFDD